MSCKITHFLKILFERESTCMRACTRGTERGGETGSLLSREPSAGLDPGALGSWPEPKADIELTEPPRRPCYYKFYYLMCLGILINSKRGLILL